MMVLEEVTLLLDVFLIVFLVSDGYHIYQASSQYLNRLVIFWSQYFYLRGGNILLSMAAEEVEQVPATDPFVPASSSSEWYKHLKRSGSCLRLYDLLEKERELIHQLGPEGITVLHKGVEHGCVKLVKFILVDMFDGAGKCTCSRCAAEEPSLTREGLVRKTSEYGSTAVNVAVVSGSPKMVLLLKWAIDTFGPKEKPVEFPERDVLRRYFDEMCNRLRRGKEDSTEAELADTANDLGIDLEVPDVKDDAIDNVYQTDLSDTETDLSNTYNMIPEVYTLIEGILKEEWGDDQEMVDLLIDSCQKDVDFGFVPVPHVFLHFLFCIYDWLSNFQLREKIVKRIVVACKERDDEKRGRGSRVVALFNMLDPRGRTILHVALEEGDWHATDLLRPILDDTLPASRRRECWNARDGAGRTILHLACIHDKSYFIDCESTWEMLNVHKMFPLHPKELEALKMWCFPQYLGADSWKHKILMNYMRPMHLAVLFNSTDMLSKLLPFRTDFPYKEPDYDSDTWSIQKPLQVAAFLGRTEFLEHFLKHQTQYNSISDLGFGKGYKKGLPAIHCAALFGQVEAIRSILKYPIYDPMIQYGSHGTALHVLVGRKSSFNEILKDFHTTTLFHVLPNNYRYKDIKNDFNKPQDDIKKVRPFSANEINCINLLLQGGINIWIPHHETNELPTPGPTADDEAQKWWYDKMIKEVVTLKTSINGAANATSVVAALVATASFIGPLQPPLGLSGDGGYVDTSRSSVQVYLVFNSLSFFFSIGSILMALLPAIPMPKESLYDELLRSQRCLKGAALMLLISIICILVSFSSASMAVVSSRWRDKGLVVGCIVVGGSVCIVVLEIYIIRLLRMLFHKNARFRRWFAKHMYF